MAAGHPKTPLISLCVPTHHGRVAALSALLEGAIEQARGLPGLVEICVSDNASADGTAELLDRLAREAPCRVAYRRYDEDRGLAHNLLGSVELAAGTYCWLMGSDDLLAARALARACELLLQFPGASGYAIGAVGVDAADPSLRSRALSRSFHPPGERSRLIDGLERIHDECGNSWCALSWSIVERDLWLRAASLQRDVVARHPVFPQVVVLAAMAAERPRWGWLAEPLVHQRNSTTFLFEAGEVSLAARWTQIIGAVASVWGGVFGGRGGRRWRRRMRHLSEVWGASADVRATKLYERPRVGEQVQLAATCLRAFWPVRGYWRAVLPASLLPIWLTRATYGPARGGGADVSRGREPAHLILAGCLPAGVTADGVTHVRLRARNGGRRTIAAAGAGAVTIGPRWSTTDGRLVEREELGVNQLAALPQSLPRPIRPGRGVAVDVVLYAPRRPGAYRVRIAAHQHGRGWLGEPGSAGVLEGDVEVLGVADG